MGIDCSIIAFDDDYKSQTQIQNNALQNTRDKMFVYINFQE